MNDIINKLRAAAAPAVGIAQFLLLIGLLAMATVMVLRMLFGPQIAIVPRLDPQAVALVGEARTEGFRRYLRASAAGFRMGMVSLMRFSFRKKY